MYNRTFKNMNVEIKIYIYTKAKIKAEKFVLNSEESRDCRRIISGLIF